jgi:type IV secretion system protein VirB10
MIDNDVAMEEGATPPEPYGSVNPTSVRRLNKNPIILMTTVGMLVGGIVVYGISQRGQHAVQTDQSIASTGRIAASEAADSLSKGAPVAGVLEAPLPDNPPVAPLDPCGGNAIPPATMQQAVKAASSVNPSLPVPAQGPANSSAPCPPTQIADAGTSGSTPQPTPYQEYVRHRAESAYAYRMKQIEQHRAFVDAAQSGETDVHFSTAGANPGAENPLAALLAQAGTSPDAISALANSGALSLPGAITPASLAGLNDPNGQISKRTFASQGNADSGYLENSVSAPIAPGEVKRGSIIPSVMITGVNSDLPGRLIAQVSEHVYDSTTGKHLLIPQGTKLFGRYDSSISYGQNRVLVVWTDLIFPNGFTLNLGGMSGSDQAGYAGFRDQKNSHTGKIFGAAILTSLLGTGVRYGSGSSNQTLNGGIRVEDAAQQEFSQGLGRVATRVIDKGLDLQPTLTIRPGYRFNIIVEKDIVLPDYPLQLVARRR